VGVYLVFASLIIPSLATRNFAAQWRLHIAYLIGTAGYAAGLLLSSVFDLPSGALIVWCLAAIAIGVYSLGPRDIEAAMPAGARRQQHGVAD
jgi:zinc/manganese transport system permease protein